jgi:putative ABC transport system ATP-binding protein/lipoprotein-releasing system ATP-binding protein
MIEANGLCKHYGKGDRQVKAVDQVDLSVGPGDFVSIMGHSGSGKTTLLSLMGGLTRPTSGTVRVDGVDLWGIRDQALARLRNRRIGFVYQFASLIPTLTALENVVLPVVFGTPPPDARERAMELLGTLGMADRSGAYPGQLSGGEQRRVAIARSFINQPAVVLADEPTGDLDEETEAEVLEFFTRMNREQVAFVLVTHSRELAALGRVRLRMDHGRLMWL